MGGYIKPFSIVKARGCVNQVAEKVCFEVKRGLLQLLKMVVKWPPLF